MGIENSSWDQAKLLIATELVRMQKHLDVLTENYNEQTLKVGLMNMKIIILAALGTLGGNGAMKLFSLLTGD